MVIMLFCLSEPSEKMKMTIEKAMYYTARLMAARSGFTPSRRLAQALAGATPSIAGVRCAPALSWGSVSP